jgi:hypothetical protein
MDNFQRRNKLRNGFRRNNRRFGSNSNQKLEIVQLHNLDGPPRKEPRYRSSGNAFKLFDKYNKLANEALSTGDKVLAESYFQHADHFARLLPNQKDMPLENYKATDPTSSEIENINIETSDLESPQTQE